MGCTESMFKKKPKEGEDTVVEIDENGEVVKDGTITEAPKKAAKNDKKEKQVKAEKDKKEKKEKEKKDKKKGGKGDNKVANGDTTNGEVKNGEAKNGSSKTGAASAKVRPLTPTPPANQNVQKPVAFDVDLEGQQANLSDSNTDAASIASAPNGGGYRLRLPRKLPKLSSKRKESIKSSGSSGQDDGPAITNEEIQEKQRKAEEKRQEILEEKKQKARKFVEKFGNNSKSASVASSADGEEEEEEDGIEPKMNGMNGLDSGLGLDGYGLEGDVKIDENGMTVTAVEGDESYRLNRIDTAASAPVVVQDGAGGAP